MDLTERPEVSSRSVDRFASSSEASDVRCVVSNGDLSCTGGPEVCWATSSWRVPFVWLSVVAASVTWSGAACSADEDGFDEAGL
jgi:hypothetical protein